MSNPCKIKRMNYSFCQHFKQRFKTVVVKILCHDFKTVGLLKIVDT